MAEGLSPQETLRRQLAALAEQFAGQLGGELDTLRTLAGSLQVDDAADTRRERLGSLRDRLHRLAGSAGTFGFALLGQDARRLEQQAIAWMEQPGGIEPAALRTFVDQVQQLRAERAAEPAPADAGPEVARRLPRDTSYRIHILEDDAAAGWSMALTLRNFGYDATHYSVPEDFRAACRDHPPDAMVVDIHLRGDDGEDMADGLALAEEVQRQLPAPVPLLVITVDNRFDTWLRAVRAGATGFFGKPVNLAELESRLERGFAQMKAEPYRILIVDDDVALSQHYALVLRAAGMEVEVEHHADRVLDVMRSFLPELLLLDVNMPGCSGPELAQIIRFNDDLLRIPIMYLSAETDIARQMAALVKAGDDFVTKPISDNGLVAAVFARAQRARLLSSALSRDSLTGLLKHGDIKEQVMLEVARLARGGKPATVAMIDIDHFKRVNDTHGHAVGDNVIRSLANLLRQRLRRADQLGRYGGEEFAALLPDCQADDAFAILDTIRKHFAEIEFMADGQPFHVTLSAGIAEILPGDTPSMPLERADRALYQAKAGGRNQLAISRDEPAR